MTDPTTDEERRKTAGRCAQSLNLDVPMAVDGVDDAVALAYNAWPERIYILKPDGTIHYKGGLGPFGFRPLEADASLAKLLGTDTYTPPGAEPQPEGGAPATFEDDGFSGIWSGQGTGSTTGGQTVPFRLMVRLAKDGTVGGRVEAGRARTRLLLRNGRLDRETGRLRAGTSTQGQPLKIDATLEGETLKGEVQRPNGTTLFTYELRRLKKSPPLVSGVEDARGSWRGRATARDPAQAGKEVELVLTEAEPKSLSGSITIDGQTAEIERGRYDARTGGLSAMAKAEDGASWRIVAQVEGTKARGSATMGAVALVVAFELELEEE